MTRRFCDVHVQADEQVELTQWPAPSCLRRGWRNHGVAGDCDKGPNPVILGSVDLLGQRRHRKLAELGSPRTRVRRLPGTRTPRPLPGVPKVVAAAGGSGNITPPGLSRLPVMTLSTTISQEASVPKFVGSPSTSRPTSTFPAARTPQPMGIARCRVPAGQSLLRRNAGGFGHCGGDATMVILNLPAAPVP